MLRKNLFFALQLPESLIRCVISQVTLLHDIGYPMQVAKRLQKSNHSLEGGMIFEKKLEQPLRDLLKQKFTNKQVDKAITLIYEGIIFHNADKKEAQGDSAQGPLLCFCDLFPRIKFDVKPFDVKPSGCIPVGESKSVLAIRFADHVKKGPKSVGIPYLDLDLNEPKHFFHFLVRFADNLDSARNRLHPFQQRVLKKVLDNIASEHTQQKQLESIVLPEFEGISDKERDFYQLLQQDVRQRKYFFGMYIVDDISVVSKGSICSDIKIDNSFSGLENIQVQMSLILKTMST